LASQRGRPVKGALSTYSEELRRLIDKLRTAHEGWGASTILVELAEEYNYAQDELPSINAINRYLKQKGFVKERNLGSRLPSEKCKTAKHFHDLWEMDAEGAVFVSGLNYVSNINIKDSKSKVHCMAFPVDVSPFPSKLLLWLIGLKVKLCFISVPPPQKQAMVERSHQTINRQTIRGQHYNYWKELFMFTNKRRKRINEKLPNRLLGKQAPLVVYPKAIHSGRFYKIEQEEQVIEMNRIYQYLRKCCWYRKTSNVRTLSLAGNIYHLKNAKPKEQIQIKFCNRTKKLVFRNVKEQIIAKLPIKKFTVQDIMGATSKELIAMKKKLFRARDFPL